MSSITSVTSSLVFILVLAATTPLGAQVIDTAAGGEVFDGRTAASAALAFPRYMAIDSKGNLFISDSVNNRIRKVDASGIISTIAGQAQTGYTGDGGPAAAATLSFPAGIVFDSQGNLLIADEGNEVIRRIDTNGIITTIAGTGSRGFSGDGGPALQATFRAPFGLDFDSIGNLFVVDTGNHAVRRIDVAGTITTIAGNGTAGFSGDGGPAASAQLRDPRSVAIDPLANIFIADTANHRVRRVDPSGMITTVAGNGLNDNSGDAGPAIAAGVSNPRGVAIDSDGSLLISSRGNVRKVDPSGIIETVAGLSFNGFNGDGLAPLSASFNMITEILPLADGDLLLADSGNSRIRRIGSGIVATVAGGFAGDGNAATAASLNQPRGLAVDSQDRLYIADRFHHRVRRVDENGLIETIAGTGTGAGSPDGGPAVSSDISGPFSVGVDSAGNVFFGNSGAAIRKIDSSGILSSIAGNGTFGFSGDGGPASQAQITLAASIRFDAAGSLFFSDIANCAVRKVDDSGTITTVAGVGACGFGGDGGAATAAQLNFPFGIDFDGAGNLYIADSENNRIRKVDAGGAIATIAGDGSCAFGGDGGPAIDAQLCTPTGVAADASGNIYIAEFNNGRVRRIDPSGIITTIAGNGLLMGSDFTGFGYSGDGGPAADALFGSLDSLAVDQLGNVYLTDQFVYRVRKMTFDPAQAIEVLSTTLRNLGLPPNPAQGLLAKLRAAGRAVARGDLEAAHRHLDAFIDQVGKKRGKPLADGQADLLTATAEAVLALL